VALFFWLRGEEQEPAVVVAPTVPDFVFPDAQGNPVALADVQAELRVITFWASWSPYSRDELPTLARVKEAYGDRIAVVALNRDTNSAEGRAFLEAIGLADELIFAYDRDDTYYKEVGGFNMPETVFVDTEGRILHHTHGPMTEEAMRAVIEEHLAQ
jgi:thiol-disulfide isomerase/thioredoxin